MSAPISGPSFFIGLGDGDLISFGSGQPDLPPPKEAFDVLTSYTSFKYGLVQGDVALREALAREYPGAGPESFVVTSGASEAIDLTLRALSSLGGPGGKVLLPRPYYYSYPYNVRYAGMEPTYYDLGEAGKIDIDNFTKAAEGVRTVMINSPSNPTGTVQDIETLRQIEKLCDERGVYIISDEVYKDLIYERGNYLLSGERVITVNSFSKTYAMCGLRIGYLYARDQKLVDSIVEMKTHTAMNTSSVSQAMALAAINAPKSYAADHLKIWRERRDHVYAAMLALGLELASPEGAFYVLPKLKQSGRVVSDLYEKYKLISYDGAWFGAPDHVRFSYALTMPKIEEGLSRLKKFLETDYKTY